MSDRMEVDHAPAGPTLVACVSMVASGVPPASSDLLPLPCLALLLAKVTTPPPPPPAGAPPAGDTNMPDAEGDDTEPSPAQITGRAAALESGHRTPERPVRVPMELVGAAKALRKELEEIEKETEVENRFKKLLSTQMSEVDKRINDMAKAREGKIEDERRILAAVNCRKKGPKNDLKWSLCVDAGVSGPAGKKPAKSTPPPPPAGATPQRPAAASTTTPAAGSLILNRKANDISTARELACTPPPTSKAKGGGSRT
ncbi:uncharacterized protein TRUGW13939_06944 [Talaromyces rugulosus]|uniref:Uncharacterized protein n=1 Tax=Talaromyces rugulosus TaxID=121627 RepID=A0A7H8R0C1_TALRU|nr:uncharacterized protein TRUGW13939_06944 [Talaromyces rugulosus]QKX59802.1 hypothetical protein TRUGW13939_06944 [Talaromyces rugulosus]